jgi:hypothetical protein
MAELDEAGEMTDASPEVGAAAERGELRRLVRAAIAGLNPGEREVIELSLHEMEGPDLASALGVPVNQAHALASRARAQLEKSLGVLLVARSGREACPELETMLASWDGQLTVLLRKRVSRHIEQCDVCGERKRRELSPAMLLSALPVFILPPALRQQVLGLVADATPEAARYRDLVARRAEPFAASGFPVPVHRHGRTRTPGRRTILFTAAAALLLIVAGGLAAVALLRHGGGAPANAAAHSAAQTGVSTSPAGPSPSPTGSGRSRADHRAARPAGSSPAATPNPVGTPSAITTTTPPSAPTPTATVSATPSPTPAPGTLEESPATITLRQSPTGPDTATFTLTADGGPVTFTITVPPSAADGLSVSPSTGSLKTGQSATVTVTVIGNGPPTFTTELTLSPGGGTVTVQYPPRG